jgi:putative ABC transport system ATP-binding protein
MSMPEHTPDGPTEVKGGLAVTEDAEAPEHAAAGHATAPEHGSLIELEGVARRYEMGEVTVTALEEVDLRIECGEFVVVLGPSGSGKTTLLNMIGALDSPTEGTIRIRGEDISGASRADLFAFRRRTFRFIFQTFNHFPALTALENFEFGADVSGHSNARAVAAETLERVGLGARATHFPHELSGGEQQRVAIARALATRNPILLADEPTGELDFRTGVQILDLLHEQTHPEETAVLIVTNNREIARVAHRVFELSSGRIVADAPNPGGPAEIADLHW